MLLELFHPQRRDSCGCYGVGAHSSLLAADLSTEDASLCGKTLQQTIRSSFPDSSYGKAAVSPVFWKGL